MKIVILLLVSVLFAIVRFFVPTHVVSAAGSYETFAHLFVGGLIGAWLVSRKNLYLGLVLGLSLVELVAFFGSK